MIGQCFDYMKGSFVSRTTQEKSSDTSERDYECVYLIEIKTSYKKTFLNCSVSVILVRTFRLG